MSDRALREAIAAFHAAFEIEDADAPPLRGAAFRLRHRVYCVETGYEPAREDGQETDPWDAVARHIVVRERGAGEVVGTVRLIPQVAGVAGSLPMQRVCGDCGALAALPPSTGEVSRFALSKELRGDAAAKAGPALRLGLVRGLVAVSGRLGLTHWCALMERRLLRLLRSTGIHFADAAPPVELRGLRVPCHVEIAAMLEQMRVERPAVFAFLTDDGRSWPGDG